MISIRRKSHSRRLWSKPVNSQKICHYNLNLHSSNSTWKLLKRTQLDFSTIIVDGHSLCFVGLKGQAKYFENLWNQSKIGFNWLLKLQCITFICRSFIFLEVLNNQLGWYQWYWVIKRLNSNAWKMPEIETN